MGNYTGGSSSRAHVNDYDMGNVNWRHNFNRYQEMIYNAAGPEFGTAYELPTEVPNLDASRFYNVLEAAKGPL